MLWYAFDLVLAVATKTTDIVMTLEQLTTQQLGGVQAVGVVLNGERLFTFALLCLGLFTVWDSLLLLQIARARAATVEEPESKGHLLTHEEVFSE